MGDGGISFGSVIATALKNGIKTFTCNNMYLGPKYDWDIDLSKYNVEKFDDDTKFIKNLIDKGFESMTILNYLLSIGTSNNLSKEKNYDYLIMYQ